MLKMAGTMPAFPHQPQLLRSGEQEHQREGQRGPRPALPDEPDEELLGEHMGRREPRAGGGHVLRQRLQPDRPHGGEHGDAVNSHQP